MIQQAKVSVVKGSDQTNHFTNRKRPCTTTENEERAICQSLLCLDLVAFSVMSRMQLQVGCVSLSLSLLCVVVVVVVVCVVCGVWGTYAEKTHVYVQNDPCVPATRPHV